MKWTRIELQLRFYFFIFLFSLDSDQMNQTLPNLNQSGPRFISSVDWNEGIYTRRYAAATLDLRPVLLPTPPSLRWVHFCQKGSHLWSVKDTGKLYKCLFLLTVWNEFLVMRFFSYWLCINVTKIVFCVRERLTENPYSVVLMQTNSWYTCCHLDIFFLFLLSSIESGVKCDHGS